MQLWQLWFNLNIQYQFADGGIDRCCRTDIWGVTDDSKVKINVYVGQILTNENLIWNPNQCIDEVYQILTYIAIT